MATQQTQLVGLINESYVMAQQFRAFVNQQVNDHVLKVQKANAAAIWAAFPSAAQNADGSLGAADSTPNPAHPINTGIAAMAGLQSDQPANTWTNLETLWTDLQKFMSNQAVTTADRHAVLDPIVQG